MEKYSYHFDLNSLPGENEWRELAETWIYPSVFRTNFEAPGFVLISFAFPVSSTELRHAMWTLKNILSALHKSKTGDQLIYLSLGRFDSQNTTKLHLDGAPEQAFLMLGYEASEVQSELLVANYSRAALDWDITPQELLRHFNPMFGGNEKRLAPYVTRLEEFTPSWSHLLLLNNSSQPFDSDASNLLGVMHGAIIRPDDSHQRIINSTMIATAPHGTGEPMDEVAQRAFVETNEITA